MALVLFIIFMITEIGFAVFEYTKKEEKKTWTKKRLIVNVLEAGVFLILLLLPGIDLSFRLAGLAAILLIRILFASLFAVFNRSNEKTKSGAAIAGSLTVSFFLLMAALVPAFVFKDYKGREVTGHFGVASCEAILLDSQRTETFEQDGSCREVPVHFYYPETVKDLPGQSIPLVIFSHGAFGYYQSNTSTFMELASNGYVVASLDHPYHSFFTRDSDGKIITVDPDFFNTALTVGNSDASEAEVYEITSKWMDLREQDMNFMIDELKGAVQTQSLSDTWYYDNDSKEKILSVLNAVNTDKIGLMGHSLGGATAVTVGRREDVSAVIDLDGTMLGEETGVMDGVIQINEESYDTPLLCIDSEIHHKSAEEAAETGYVYANNVILHHAKDGFEVYFKDTGHMNFTDLPLFSPVLAKKLGTGSVDAGECIDQINSLVLCFFDSYLKDAGAFSARECY